VVPNATITVVSTDKAVTVRSLRTSSGGQYVVPLLTVGHYNVTAEASGFNRSSQTDIELSVNDRRTINFILQVRAQISERVNVQFRAEATNLLNHTNFDGIGTFFLFDPIHLGQVVSARDTRIIQLGLKVVF